MYIYLYICMYAYICLYIYVHTRFMRMPTERTASIRGEASSATTRCRAPSRAGVPEIAAHTCVLSSVNTCRLCAAETACTCVCVCVCARECVCVCAWACVVSVSEMRLFTWEQEESRPETRVRVSMNARTCNA